MLIKVFWPLEAFYLCIILLEAFLKSIIAIFVCLLVNYTVISLEAFFNAQYFL